MKRQFLLFAILLGGVQFSFAQKKLSTSDTKFSVGAEVGIVTGSASTGWGLGVGGSVQAEHFFQENISGTALAGFTTYFGKSAGAGIKNKAYNVIPLRIGGRYYIQDAFHVGAQVGVGFLSVGGASTTAFAYSPQIGYNFETNNGKSIDATLKYDAYAKNGTFSAVGVRLAYVF